ncbi:MAG: DUF1338 domain-containing protein [Planctomycetia bacterium]|nr:DUF1338 domain-containing protein [Planctomycetia bacterium]
MTTSISTGPHLRIPVANAQERFACELFDSLWDRYRQRVVHVRSYEQLIASAGATFVNDHIAFRTIAGQSPLTGISLLSRLFEALGYRAANCYQFEDKHLSAIHFQHPNGQFPKLFISELKSWELSSSARDILHCSASKHRTPISEDLLVGLHQLKNGTVSPTQQAQWLQTAVESIQDLPWPVPEMSDVITINKESQYAAWVLVHGNNVNHFTSLINSHGVESLGDIEKTIAALQQAGVPVKTEIEGDRGTKLRQSATEAAVIDVAVRDQGRETTMSWTYAYFELAERGFVTDPETSTRSRFEGFLGPQATQLFEMTRTNR